MYAPEESFEILRQFCSSGIARVHGDEDTNGGNHLNGLAEKDELSSFCRG